MILIDIRRHNYHYQAAPEMNRPDNSESELTSPLMVLKWLVSELKVLSEGGSLVRELWN